MKKRTACLYIDQNNIFFRYKKLDFSKLLKELKKEFDIVKAVSYMALDKESTAQKNFITYLSNNGFKCVTIDIGTGTNVDHILIADMCNDYKNVKPDNIILMSGDAHFAYGLGIMSLQGATINVIGAKDYVAYDLLKICDDIRYIENFDKVIIEP